MSDYERCCEFARGTVNWGIKKFGEMNREYFNELIPNIEDSYIAEFILGGIDRMTKKIMWIISSMKI